METHELKKVCIKNRTRYYFDEIEDFDIDNILIDEKSHQNMFIYGISYKALTDPKPFHIRFDKIDGFIRIFDGTRCLKLFSSQKYDDIYDRIR